MSRRAMLQATGIGLAAPFLIPQPTRAQVPTFTLRPAPGAAPLVAPEGPPTRAWLYNGSAPGPLIRARQGEMLRVEVENALAEPTTVHWHGLRIPIRFDGVPVLSQDPIPPGETYSYDLTFADAGTFWYHPHVNSSEQVGRGLNGVLIVDEPPEALEGLAIDREIIWALDDWRLDRSAQIAEFGQFHDASHGGRIGNVVTVNGAIDPVEPVRAGERVRLRMINMGNAITFRPRFSGLDAWLVALDGHPVPPRELNGDGVLLGAGQRADVILDMTLAPGETVSIFDDAFGAEYRYRLKDFVASEEPPVETARRGAPTALPANPVPRPVLESAQTHALTFEGGAMGGMSGAMMMGRFMGMRELAQAGRLWAINGVVPGDFYSSEPVLDLALGESHVVDLVNNTVFPHPIHLHGHSFFVLQDGAEGLDGAPIRDTVLLAPGEAASIAFVADNPGPWMLHCHILEHQEAGMMGVVMVA